jgi:26S proteasome regulatory subunit N2
MGLILLGTADAGSAEEMLTYARETQHEKIIRGLAVGVGFIYYGRQEEVDETIQLLLAEKVCYVIVFVSHLLMMSVGPHSPIRQCIHISISLCWNIKQ